MPHGGEFEMSGAGYSIEYANNDVWATTIVGEARQVLVTSWIDYVATLAPHLLGLLGLRMIKARLCRRHLGQTLGSLSSVAPTAPRPVGPSVNHILAQKDVPAPASRFRQLLLRCFHGSMVGWAVVVLWSHVEARKWEISTSGSATHNGCMVQVQAWYTHKIPCAAFQFNCHRLGQIAGAARDVIPAFEILDRYVLRRVVFSHCHALEVPPLVVQGFPNLNSIATFNSTIHRWDESAKLTRQHTATMAQLQFIDTNMSALPTGIIHSDLPAVLHLIIHGSNLSQVPSGIVDVWRKVFWSTLWLERTQLTELPVSFDQLDMAYVSFQGSPITTLPPSLFGASTELAQLRLTDTLLRDLPDAPRDMASLVSVLADNTKMETVPV